MTTRAFISKTTADYLPNLAAAAQDAGNGGIVIANGFLLGADLNTAAGQFPEHELRDRRLSRRSRWRTSPRTRSG